MVVGRTDIEMIRQARFDTLRSPLTPSWTGQANVRVQARIGVKRAGLRPILSLCSPMGKSGLKFC